MSTADTATFVLIPGAGGDAYYWHLVAGMLAGAGHDVVTVALTAGDDNAGLAEYCEATIQQIGARQHHLVLVAQSMAGFTAPMVAARIPVSMIILVNAMTPLPGESPGQWWETTGHAAAADAAASAAGRTRAMPEDFFHDVPPDVRADVFSRPEPAQSGTPFLLPWPLSSWPAVPTVFLQGESDRFFPIGFQRELVRRRLGLEIVAVPGGHLNAFSRPRELTDQLLAEWNRLPAG